MKWKNVKDETPNAYKKGHWDGSMSDPVVAMDKNGKFHIAVVYEGYMDGSHFIDFYDDRDFELSDIEYWCEITGYEHLWPTDPKL